MSNDNEDFDNIVNNLGDADNEEEDFDNLMEMIADYWKAFHPGELFVKGILIVESATTDGRALCYESSNPSSDWEVLGMLETVKQQLQSNNVLERMGLFAEDDEDNEGGDDDD